MLRMKPILTEVLAADGTIELVPDFYASEDNRGCLKGHELMLWELLAEMEDEAEADEDGEEDDGDMPLLWWPGGAD